MSDDTLDVYDAGDGWRICWIIGDDQGGDVGEFHLPECGPGHEDYESYVVQEVVRAATGCLTGPSKHDGFYFTIRKEAVAAKRAADFARKNIDTPMPAWAITAAANGWKAPKGWKP